MKYIKDTENKYYDDIIKTLSAYNLSQTGDLKNENKSFYIVEEEKLLGGIKVNFSWDWVTINHIKYDSIDTLKHLIMHVCKAYSKDGVGIKYSSEFEEIIFDLIELGFDELDTIKYSPMMREVTYLENTSFNITSDLNKNIMITDMPRVEFDEELEMATKILKEKYKTNYQNRDLTFVALEEDKFIGGVYGVVYEDHMYIDLLVVCENKKGEGIGRTLMDKIELEISNTTVKTISLGTTEFQAKEFYEKLGYKTVMTQHDLPKGFDCYTLLKDLSQD